MNPKFHPCIQFVKCPYLKSQDNCSKLLHDYIKCIHDDETCCADLYQKYLKCTSIQQHIQSKNEYTTNIIFTSNS